MGRNTIVTVSSERVKRITQTLEKNVKTRSELEWKVEIIGFVGRQKCIRVSGRLRAS